MAKAIGIAADFVSVNDWSFDLQHGKDIDNTLKFEFPPSTSIATTAGVLTWNLRAETSGKVTYEIYINSQKQTTQSVSGTDWHTVQEVFDTSILTSTDDNEIKFLIISGSARLSIGDVALWFRKRIFDPHS